MRYSLVKVLLTVSPFRSSSSPQPHVYPRSLFRLTSHHPLPTSRPPFFSCTYKSLRPPARFRGPLLSYTYKTIFLQILSIHIHTKPPGCGGLQLLPNSVSSVVKKSLTPFPATHTQNAPVTPFAATHTKSTSRNSFPCHTSEKTRGVGVLWLTSFDDPNISARWFSDGQTDQRSKLSTRYPLPSAPCYHELHETQKPLHRAAIHAPGRRLRSDCRPNSRQSHRRSRGPRQIARRPFSAHLRNNFLRRCQRPLRRRTQTSSQNAHAAHCSKSDHGARL